MPKRMKKWVRPVLFFLCGVIGLLYYTFWGCTSGCPITSSHLFTAAYIGLIGWLLSGITASKKG